MLQIHRINLKPGSTESDFCFIIVIINGTGTHLCWDF